jgi:hypothetical protein
MEHANPAGLLIVAIMAIVLIILFAVINAEESNRIPVEVNTLISIATLGARTKWNVTIMRRSGYVHDAWAVTGSAKSAIDLGVSKLRQARITTVVIVRNETECLEVRAFYDSAGRRRTGKYVGGFIITPA